MITMDDADYIVKTLDNLAHLLIWLWGALVGMLILMSFMLSLQFKSSRDELFTRLDVLIPEKPETPDSDAAET